MTVSVREVTMNIFDTVSEANKTRIPYDSVVLKDVTEISDVCRPHDV